MGQIANCTFVTFQECLVVNLVHAQPAQPNIGYIISRAAIMLGEYLSVGKH